MIGTWPVLSNLVFDHFDYSHFKQQSITANPSITYVNASFCISNKEKNSLIITCNNIAAENA